MQGIVTIVTICCGAILLLSPMLFTHAVQPDFFIWAQIVGGAMCSSGVGLAFVVHRKEHP